MEVAARDARRCHGCYRLSTPVLAIFVVRPLPLQRLLELVGGARVGEGRDPCAAVDFLGAERAVAAEIANYPFQQQGIAVSAVVAGLGGHGTIRPVGFALCRWASTALGIDA